MKKQIKKERGITLIALVVTIIVLLILAGVSISMLAGDNGIIRQSQRAKEETKIGEEKEQVKLSYSAVIAGNNGQEVTRKQLEDELKKYDDRITVEEDGDNFKVTFPSSNVYTIDKNGKVEEAEKSDVSISLTIKGTKVENPPIPSGFVHVGGSINEGYVISDAQEDENKDVDSDDLKGNQFVWVPVEKDQKITLKVTSQEDITSIVITDPYGDEILKESNKGTTYNNEEIEPTINGPYRVVISTNSGIKVKYLNVNSLYAVSTFFDLEFSELLNQLEGNYDSNETFEETFEEKYQQSLKTKILEYFLKETGMTEEEFEQALESQGMNKEQFIEEVIGYDSLEEEATKVAGGEGVKLFYRETEDYTEEVNTNGGFFIGRYEAGDSSATKQRDSIEQPGTLVTQKNKYVYNNITSDTALSKAHEYATSIGETNVTSSLLTGAAWDRVVGWIYESGNKTKEEILNSKSWGHYEDDEFSGTEDFIKTGAFEQTRANNIYDLAGNVWEQTLEVDSNNHDHDLFRGGSIRL